MITTAAIALGQMVITLGVRTRRFGVVLLGRIMYGLCGDTLWMIETLDITRWFINNEF